MFSTSYGRSAEPEALRAGLTSRELQRYSRHVLLPEVGPDGQGRLKAASVLCVGVGGLGSPAALYLAAAGIGRIGLADFDVVDESNLQRQVLHATPDVGRAKLASARDRLNALNPAVEIETHGDRLTAANALDVLRSYDVVIDGSDNFPTRYLVNDACVMLGKPDVYGSIFRFEGQASVFATRQGPCYRCLHPDPPPPGLVPDCAEAGVLGVLPGVIGTIQATEAIKLILGVGDPLVGRFLMYDALSMRFREVRLPKDPECPVCGTHPTIQSLSDGDDVCGAPGVGTASRVTSEDERVEMTVDQLKAKLDSGQDLVLLDVREPHETAICNIDGSLLMPLGELPRRFGELDASREVVVYCRSGVRSRRAVAFLRQQGYAQAVNLRGGILQWVDRIDPSQPRY
jgi:adenylyltransferase/sulfurtransferase